MPLTWEQSKQAIEKVFKFLDNINLKIYLDLFENIEVRTLMDCLENKYPYDDGYSWSLFDIVSEEDFIDYLTNKYNVTIAEETITKYYIK